MNVNVVFSVIILPFVSAFFPPELLPMETDPGVCPRPTTLSNFEPERLVGVWYDIKRYKNTVMTGSCGTATYTWHPSNSSFDIPYKMLEYPTNVLTITAMDLDNGKFHTDVNGFWTPFDYWLMDTDYENYHIVYTCIELIPSILNSQSINIYSRKPTLDDEHLQLALASLNANKLNVKKLRNVQQDNTICRRN